MTAEGFQRTKTDKHNEITIILVKNCVASITKSMERVSREAVPIICNFMLFKDIMKKCRTVRFHHYFQQWKTCSSDRLETARAVMTPKTSRASNVQMFNIGLLKMNPRVVTA